MIKTKIDWFFILLLGLSVITILPFFHSGFYPIHDDTQVARIFEMSKALGDGMFPVRWVKDLGYGYGYPIFNFYAPLPYYFGGLMSLFRVDPLLSTKFVFGFGVLLSGVTMYIFLKKFFSPPSAILGAVVYLYFPYHAVNAFVRGDVGEIYSYIFYPLVFYGLLKIHSGKKTRKEIIPSILLSSIAFALVIVSHNLSAFMLFIFVAMFISSSIIFGRARLALILSYSGVMLLAFLISASYTLPALFEMGYTNVFSQIGGGASYADHFVCIGQLWSSQWGFGGSTKGCIDGLSFALGKLNIAIVFFSPVIFFFTFKKNKQIFLTAFSIVSLIVAVFLMLQISDPLWKLPYFDFVQYPWRFLAFAGFFIAVLSAFCADSIKALLKSHAFISFIIMGVFVTIYINSKYFVPQKFLSVDSLSYTNINYIKTVTSKISDEYLPGNFNKKRQISSQVFSADNSKIDIITNKTNNMKADISLVHPSRLDTNIAYFPAWKIYIDGKEREHLTQDGLIYTNIDSGQHTVELRFIETPIENLGDFLSIIGILSVVFLDIIVKGKIYEKKIT